METHADRAIRLAKEHEIPSHRFANTKTYTVKCPVCHAGFKMACRFDGVKQVQSHPERVEAFQNHVVAKYGKRKLP